MTNNESINKKIIKQLESSPVVLYMKGNPNAPACGFSRAIVEVLRREGLSEYNYFDILQDDELRQGIKEFSKWPTIPQLYVLGEFIGGCDIVMDMHSEGTLTEILKKSGAKMKEL